MADTKHLEDAKSSLQSAQAGLQHNLNTAETTLAGYEVMLSQANHEVSVANLRYDKLEALTRSLCDICWELLPTLEESKFKRNGGRDTCVNCGMSRFHSPDAYLPPMETNSLNQAESALHAAEAAIKGEPQSPHGLRYGHSPYYRGHNVTPLWQSGRGQYHYNSNQYGLRYGQQGEKSKANLLRVAEEQKQKANSKVLHTEECIQSWTLYHNQHKEQLEKVNKALVDVEDKERQVLESKLSKLSGGKRGIGHIARGNSLTECSICMEREKDMVFQCGHQCCSVCAVRITHCHTCRAWIVQRIKLHG
jgi:hypothetical protein